MLVVYSLVLKGKMARDEPFSSCLQLFSDFYYINQYICAHTPVEK